MSSPQLKTLNLEIRIPYSDTPYFLQLHSSSTVSHLKSKLFRKTSSLEGRKLDSYNLAIKRQSEEAFDVLVEDKKVVKSHPLIEDEFHKNKLVTLYLVKSMDLNNDITPKAIMMNRGNSEQQFRSAPLTSPSRYSVIPPNPFPSLLNDPFSPLSTTGNPLAQSIHRVVPSSPTIVPFSPPSFTVLARSKSEPSIRRSLSNSLTNLPLYQLSNPSMLSHISISTLESGVGSESSEPLSSHCDSDTESMEDLEDEREPPHSFLSLLPAPPPPPSELIPPQSPAFTRKRAATAESRYKEKEKVKVNNKDAKNDGKADKSTTDSSKSEKTKDKKTKKEKHSWWRRDDKDKPKDKEKSNKDSRKEALVVTASETKQRLSMKMPHLHPITLMHAYSPQSCFSPPEPYGTLKTSSPSSSSFSSDSCHTEPYSTMSFSAPPSNFMLSTSPPTNPASLPNSPQSTSPTTPPLTPTPARSHPNRLIKFAAQTAPMSSFPPPPAPPKLIPDYDLSNKRGNTGLVVEDDPAGKPYVIADRDIPDKSYYETFLCTLNYFTTMEYVQRKLIERYEYPGEGDTFAQWRPMIRARVLTVLRSALESHEYLFERNPTLLVELRKFLESVRHSHPSKKAVHEFDTLLNSAPPPPSLARTGSGTQNVSTFPISPITKPSTGASHPMLDRSTSSTFISLASSQGSSSSSSSSLSTSPNNSPSESNSLTLILGREGDVPTFHSDVRESTDPETQAKAQVFHSSHSQSSLTVPPNFSPNTRHLRRDSISESMGPFTKFSSTTLHIVMPQDTLGIPGSLIPPGLSKKFKTSKIMLKIRPIDMAKQLTILEKDMFCKICPTDLMMAAWKKKDKAQSAPNVVRVIDWFNKIAAWAQTVVVVTNSLRERIAVLSRIIQIAEHCIELHNYSTGMELVSGLRCSSVSRLARTWKGLGKKETAAWESMSEIFDQQGNFTTYRKLIHHANGEPSLPYLGVVLQDLLMVEELPTLLPNKMVNFKKMRRFAGLLRDEIFERQAAAAKYSFEPTPQIQEYFIQFAPLPDADLYKWSRNCEPTALS